MAFADNRDMVALEENSDTAVEEVRMEPRRSGLVRLGLAVAAAVLAGVGLALLATGSASTPVKEQASAIIGLEADHTCPAGYVAAHWDIGNGGIARLHSGVADLDACAVRCNSHNGCEGFEYNQHALHCWTSDEIHFQHLPQHAGWLSCVRGVDHVCPTGYTATHLDISNAGDARLHNGIANLNACGQKCNQHDGCKGFEYSENANHCWTSDQGHYESVPQHAGWLSCIKDSEPVTSVCEEDVQASHTCPPRYCATDWDIGNGGDAKLHYGVPHLEACGERCNTHNGCKGFEYSEHARHCWTSDQGHFKSIPQHASWVSCIKEGEAISSDGEEDLVDESEVACRGSGCEQYQ